MPPCLPSPWDRPQSVPAPHARRRKGWRRTGSTASEGSAPEQTRGLPTGRLPPPFVAARCPVGGSHARVGRGQTTDTRFSLCAYRGPLSLCEGRRGAWKVPPSPLRSCTLESGRRRPQGMFFFFLPPLTLSSLPLSPQQSRTSSSGGTCPRPAWLSAASPPCTCCWSGKQIEREKRGSGRKECSRPFDRAHPRSRARRSALLRSTTLSSPFPSFSL